MNTFAARFFGKVVIVVLALTSAAGADAPDGRYTVTSGTVYDSKTKLTWQQAVPATTYAWAAAKTYCAGVGATLGGTGWRLPTRNELLTIVDYSRTNPSIDPTAFPPTLANQFWSSSPLAGSSSNAWFVGFSFGYSVYDGMSYPYNVRCVR
jgi:formylglycine-generating enzyme required for sulfatase activity